MNYSTILEQAEFSKKLTFIYCSSVACFSVDAAEEEGKR